MTSFSFLLIRQNNDPLAYSASVLVSKLHHEYCAQEAECESDSGGDEDHVHPPSGAQLAPDGVLVELFRASALAGACYLCRRVSEPLNL